MDSFLLLEISISTSFVKQIVIILRPHATTVAAIANSMDIFMKKNDVIDEIKNARLLKALYLPKPSHFLLNCMIYIEMLYHIQRSLTLQ